MCTCSFVFCLLLGPLTLDPLLIAKRTDVFFSELIQASILLVLTLAVLLRMLSPLLLFRAFTLEVLAYGASYRNAMIPCLICVRIITLLHPNDQSLGQMLSHSANLLDRTISRRSHVSSHQSCRFSRIFRV